MTKTPVQTGRLRAKLAERKLKQIDVARRLDLDPASVSYLFRGQRKLKLEEASQLADLLGAPLLEVIEQFGIPVHQTACPCKAGLITTDS